MITKIEEPYLTIVHVASEVKPLSVSGGLSMVTRDLPAEQAKLGHAAAVISPWYPCVDENAKKQGLEIKSLGTVENIPFAGGMHSAELGECTVNGVKHLLVKHPYFSRDSNEIYGFDDDAERFAFFDRAVPQVIASQKIKPDMIHCHDWQAGFIPTILKHGDENLLKDRSLKNVPTTLTIHNIEYDGNPPNHEHMTHLLRLPKGIAQKTHYEYGGKANPMWSGIGNADFVNTVSPNYAKELYNRKDITPFNLSENFPDKIKGILNGISPEKWDPSEFSYKEGDIQKECGFDENNMTNKLVAKSHLMKQHGFTDLTRPLIGVVSRQEKIKGMDVLAASIDKVVEQGFNIIIGGNGHNPDIKKQMLEVAAKYPNNVSVEQGWINAKEVFAGSDFCMVPSRKEPCGLTQMEGQSQGAAPIVRKTGGLADTVEHNKTGIVFDDVSVESLTQATAQAAALYKNRHQDFETMQKDCIMLDNSWEKSAQEYIAEYRQAIKEKAVQISR